MALAHGVNANLVRRWIMLALRDRTSVRASRAALVPVVTTAEAAAAPASMAATPMGESVFEVVLPGGTIRMRGVVEPSTLTIVLDCLQRPS
jgi:transposase